MLNQIFPVIYHDTRFIVDPLHLMRSSYRFQEIIKPFISHGFDIKTLHLRITYDKFSIRNIQNFLKICQNLRTDVQNSEIKEICEIASLFQADEIYQRGIDFIQNNINPNFIIKHDKYENSQYLLIESDEATIIHHAGDLNELEYDDDCDINEECSEFQVRNDFKKQQSCYYQVIIEKSMIKRKKYILIKDDKILFTAKQKDNEIFIGEGNDVHIKKDKMAKNSKIIQNLDGFNDVITEEQEFKIKYDQSKFSLEVAFMHNGMNIVWAPKNIQNLKKLNGQFDHIPIQSRKNIILQNRERHTTFIFRKMNKKIFEAECHLSVSPLVVFAIAISQIIGPYN